MRFRPCSHPTLRVLLFLFVPTVATAPAVANQEFEADALRAHVERLASDELEGRATGKPGNVRAAAYLAGVFEEIGLEAGGDEGSFLQAVPLVRTGIERVPRVVLRGADGEALELVYGADFTLQGGRTTEGRLTLVHVYDEEELPEEADSNTALYLHTARSRARKWLEEAGHSGGEGFGAILFRGRSKGGPPGFRPYSRVATPERSPGLSTPRILLHGEVRDRVESGEFSALEVELEVLHDEIESHNVIGKLAGVGSPERPELGRQAVVFSAHFDHLGVKYPPAGATPEELAELDLILNGADDDASGTACVLELARAFAAGRPPARSLIFMLATGEEMGMLGTYYYLDHPLVPLEETSCNLNFEMIGRPDELVGGKGKLWLTGHERSNLFDAINAGGIPISGDLRPKERFFSRSDNYPFAVRGVVAQTFSSYNMHQDYHQVSDEAETLDYDHMAACVDAAYKLSRLVADGEIDPAWHEGGMPKSRRR